jgi:hypothetical protein
LLDDWLLPNAGRGLHLLPRGANTEAPPKPKSTDAVLGAADR